MIGADTLLAVGVVLGVAAVAALLSWLSHAAWTTLGERRLAGRRDAVLIAIAATLGGGDEAPAVDALARLAMQQRIAILIEMAFTVAGEQRRRLDRVARETGIVDRAERWGHSRRWNRRLRAARLLALFGSGQEAVAETLLADRRPEVRAEAAQLAAEHPTPERIEQLVAMLADPYPLCSFAAREALVRGGRAAQPALLRSLTEAAAVPQAVADRRETVGRGDGSSEAVLGALEVARGIPEPEFLAPAIELTSSSHPMIRSRAASVAGAVGGSDAADALTALLADRDPNVRSAAAAGLGDLGLWQSAAPVSALLNDPVWSVRRTAGLALTRMGPTGELLLRRAVRGGSSKARDIARLSLNLEPDVKPVLEPAGSAVE